MISCERLGSLMKAVNRGRVLPLEEVAGEILASGSLRAEETINWGSSLGARLTSYGTRRSGARIVTEAPTSQRHADVRGRFTESRISTD